MRARPSVLAFCLTLVLPALETVLTEEVPTVRDKQFSIWNEVRTDWAVPLLMKFLAHRINHRLDMRGHCGILSHMLVVLNLCEGNVMTVLGLLIILMPSKRPLLHHIIILCLGNSGHLGLNADQPGKIPFNFYTGRLK